MPTMCPLVSRLIKQTSGNEMTLSTHSVYLQNSKTGWIGEISRNDNIILFSYNLRFSDLSMKSIVCASYVLGIPRWNKKVNTLKTTNLHIQT